MRPALDVTQAHARSAALRDRDRDTAGELLRTMRVSTVLEERQATLDRIQAELDEFVGYKLRVGHLAPVDSDQLARVDFEAELRSTLAS